MREPGEILLVSAYALGHTPVGIAWPAAFLRRAGFAPTLVDLAHEPLGDERLRRARLVAYHVPMHTAMRIALAVHDRARRVNPAARSCFFGHYAHLHRDFLLGERGADFALGGECEEALVALCEALANRRPEPFGIDGVHERGREAAPVLRRLDWVAPDRTGLPPLARYVQLARGTERRRVGYVEASRGCKHVCRHCPITPVYRGRFFAVPVDVVLADVDRLVAAGAQHITFGDPDFLNGPTHALRVARRLHERHPGVTFDVTAKVEHLLQHAALLPELRDLGCLFVVSAFESLSDEVLVRLEKGHTREDVLRVLALAREVGLPVRPSFVPFTPWSTPADVLEIFELILAEELYDLVDPVQLSIRLLVPRGSALLVPENAALFRPSATDPLSCEWFHADERMDLLQRALAAIAEEGARVEEDPALTLVRMRALAYRVLAGTEVAEPRVARHRHERWPRLTEPWFC